MTETIELLVDGSCDSKEAIRLLDESGIEYRLIWADGHKLPTVYYMDIEFSGLYEIKSFIGIDLATNMTEMKDSVN